MLEAALTKARAWRALIAEGHDPAEVEARRRAAARPRLADSFSAVAEAFIAHIHQLGQRSARDVENALRAEFIPRWADLPVGSITSADVVAVIDDAKMRGVPYRAANLLSVLRRVFDWAIARQAYGLTGSPFDRLKTTPLIGKLPSRSRVLSDDELRALWKASDAIGYPWGPFVRLLALTLQRVSDVAEVVRSELDLECELWTLPPNRMKSGAGHVVPLAPMAAAVFRSLPEFTRGPFMFTTTFGVRPIAGFSRAKIQLDALMLAELRRSAGERGEDPGVVTLPGWTFHDIRRTGRTGLAALGIPDTIAEVTIAHKLKGLHAVYNLHTYVDEKRDALELWAAKLRDIVEPPRRT
jgi:integrase